MGKKIKKLKIKAKKKLTILSPMSGTYLLTLQYLLNK